jgi:hypothetical protein
MPTCVIRGRKLFLLSLSNWPSKILIVAIGFFGLFFLHYSPPLGAGTLAIIAAGLSLIQVGGFNIVLESTPRQLSGKNVEVSDAMVL